MLPRPVPEPPHPVALLLDRSPAAGTASAEARKAIERAAAELVRTLREHHSGTAEHSNRLATACRAVGGRLGLPADELRTAIRESRR